MIEIVCSVLIKLKCFQSLSAVCSTAAASSLVEMFIMLFIGIDFIFDYVFDRRNTVNTRIKEPVIFCFRLMCFLYKVGCVVRNQPGVVLKRFLKGHSHAILAHFKNQKYVLTSMNACK